MSLTNMQLDKQKKILIVIFSILIVYVDTAYILKAQLAALNSLNPKIVRLENDLKNLNRNLESMRASKGKPGESAKKTALKSSKILSEGQISGLLEDISNNANKLDIKIIQIHPVHEATATKSTGIPDKLAPVMINLEIVCGYHNLGRFINRLENSDVFMGVQDIKISTQSPDYMKQKVTLVIKTYVFK